MLKTLVRSFLAVVVLVNLTGAVLCLDTQCATERAECSDHHEVEVCCTDTDTAHEGEQDHHPADEHCSSCSHCSVSVIVCDDAECTSSVTRSIALKYSSEEPLVGWVSLPERPPSA